ncbi:hypothetical protein LZC95_28690 [Pendulispora brunnea]|uniref:Uncharacterized protein n=1 Tax=Pendulispora brunnea TaxID=2905690 RepID=A0ABZ2K110_9BACT
MPFSCPIVSKWCLVFGFDLHEALGPLGIHPWQRWISISTARWLGGDSQSSSVFGDGNGFLKRGSDTRYLRPHICLSNAAPPISFFWDSGLIIPNILLGATKTIWGPYSIKANITDKGDNPAVHLPLLNVGVDLAIASSTVCSKPFDLPSTVSIQLASSVLLGMTIGDLVGNASNMLLDSILSMFLSLGLGHSMNGLHRLLTNPKRGPALRSLGEKLAPILSSEMAEGKISQTFLREFIIKGIGDIMKDGHYVSHGLHDGAMKLVEALGERISGNVNDASDRIARGGLSAFLSPVGGSVR